jgi:hypothetical protein
MARRNALVAIASQTIARPAIISVARASKRASSVSADGARIAVVYTRDTFVNVSAS